MKDGGKREMIAIKHVSLLKRAAAIALCLFFSSFLFSCGSKPQSSREPINVESISLEGDLKDLVLGETLSLKSTVSPDNADDKSVSWTSSDESVLVVNEKGEVTAVGGGSAVITVTASNGLAASETIEVDGSRRLMHLSINRLRDDENHIGDEWEFHTELNGNTLARELVVAVGDTLECYARFTEKDDKPDVGEASASHTVTEDDFANGFAITMELNVTENGGRNSGLSAHFTVTYTFSV